MLSQVFAKPRRCWWRPRSWADVVDGLPERSAGDHGRMLRRAGVDAEPRAAEVRSRPTPPRTRPKAAKKEPEKVEKLLDLDAMELEVGYGLVRLVDASQGRRPAGSHQPDPPADRHRPGHHRPAGPHPRQHAARAPTITSIKIKGQAVAKGVTYPEQFLAMDNGADHRPHSRRHADHRAGLRAAGVLDHRIRSAPGRAAQLHRRRGHRRAGHASDGSHQVARPRTAHPPGSSKTCWKISKPACRP